ncbi:hypothetical protein LUR56_21650 [Streptomyces sp. MT29]|nr:hypothetical protein [Streptomyces sp. MT29]
MLHGRGEGVGEVEYLLLDEQGNVEGVEVRRRGVLAQGERRPVLDQKGPLVRPGVQERTGLGRRPRRGGGRRLDGGEQGATTAPGWCAGARRYGWRRGAAWLVSPRWCGGARPARCASRCSFGGGRLLVDAVRGDQGAAPATTVTARCPRRDDVDGLGLVGLLLLGVASGT